VFGEALVTSGEEGYLMKERRVRAAGVRSVVINTAEWQLIRPWVSTGQSWPNARDCRHWGSLLIRIDLENGVVVVAAKAGVDSQVWRFQSC
jgi:hypothetical protein